MVLEEVRVLLNNVSEKRHLSGSMSFGGVIRQNTHRNLQLEIERYGQEQKQG